jgi:Fanconi anemia group M protein
MADFEEHPLLKAEKVESRLYQKNIVKSVLSRGNTLIILPTALGKTIVAALLAAHLLESQPNSKVLFIAPTKPLALQHFETLKAVLELPEEKFVLLTGSTKISDRIGLWENASVVSATPQTIENDLKKERIRLDNVSLLVVDESHHTVKSYSYVDVARLYFKQSGKPLIIGLTASPSIEKIKEVCSNLKIKNIETRTEQDADVAPYVQKKEIERAFVELPDDFQEVRTILRAYMGSLFKKLVDSNLVYSKAMRKGDILKLQRRMIEQKNFPGIIVTTALIKTWHAVELLETQGISSLHTYFNKIREDKKKTSVKLSKDLARAMELTDILYIGGKEHPKIEKLKEVLRRELEKNPGIQGIIFAHFRDSAQKIIDVIEDIPGVKPVRFVGQASKQGDIGLSQDEQKEIIDDFRNKRYNFLVCTSIGEEGLDIPSVDIVIFYEPVPSEIRKIQREGRTGRKRAGKVVVLITRKTMDESRYWASHYKQKKMRETLENMKKPQKTMDMW